MWALKTNGPPRPHLPATILQPLLLFYFFLTQPFVHACFPLSTHLPTQLFNECLQK